MMAKEVKNNGKKGWQCGECGVSFTNKNDCDECHDLSEPIWFTDDKHIVLHRELKEDSK